MIPRIIAARESDYFLRLRIAAGSAISTAMRKSQPPPEPELPQIEDEPGMAERFQRGLQRALNTPPQRRATPAPKAKERPASKGRVHKGKTRS